MRKNDSSLPDLFDIPEAGPCDRVIERDAARRWKGQIAGIDEAGRGPWAGPVVTAAVILTDAPLPEGLTDSKKLSAARREELFDVIMSDHVVAVASASARRIDATDIRAATLWAMTRAVAGLARRPVGVLVDGRDVPTGLREAGYRAMAIVKGDSRAACIAAASIIAKVTRDRMMASVAIDHPGYGFERHMGYGTAFHQDALTRLGATSLHRMSFKPLKALSDTSS